MLDALLALALLGGGEPTPETAPPDDRIRFEGVWSFASVEVDGAKQPAQPFETNKIVFDRSGAYLVVEVSRVTRGTYQLDSTTMPRQFDVRVHGADLEFQSIYEFLADDAYRSCGSYRGGARPTAFTTSPGSGLILHVMHREAQSAEDALRGVARLELAGNWIAEAPPASAKDGATPAPERLEFQFNERGECALTRLGSAPRQATVRALPYPPQLDLPSGGSSGGPTLGVYEVKGDKLTIRWAEPGEPRPRDFSSPEGAKPQTLPPRAMTRDYVSTSTTRKPMWS